MNISSAPSHTYATDPAGGAPPEYSSTDPSFAPPAFAVKQASWQAPARYRRDEAPFQGEHSGRADRAYLEAERCFDNNAARLLMCNLVPGAVLVAWVSAAGAALYLAIASHIATYTVSGVALLGIAMLAAWREAGMTIIAVDGIDGRGGDWRAGLWGRRTVPVMATIVLMYLGAAVFLVPFLAPSVMFLYQMMYAPAIAAHRECGPLGALRRSWRLVSEHDEDARRTVLNLVPNRKKRAYKDFRRFAWLTLPLIPSATYLLVAHERETGLQSVQVDDYIKR